MIFITMWILKLIAIFLWWLLIPLLFPFLFWIWNLYDACTLAQRTVTHPAVY